MWRIALITSGTVADRSERSACNEESTDSSLAHGSYCVLCRDLEQDLLGELLCTINVLSYASLNSEGETPSIQMYFIVIITLPSSLAQSKRYLFSIS